MISPSNEYTVYNCRICMNLLLFLMNLDQCQSCESAKCTIFTSFSPDCLSQSKQYSVSQIPLHWKDFIWRLSVLPLPGLMKKQCHWLAHGAFLSSSKLFCSRCILGYTCWGRCGTRGPGCLLHHVYVQILRQINYMINAKRLAWLWCHVDMGVARFRSPHSFSGKRRCHPNQTVTWCVYPGYSI